MDTKILTKDCVICRSPSVYNDLEKSILDFICPECGNFQINDSEYLSAIDQYENNFFHGNQLTDYYKFFSTYLRQFVLFNQIVLIKKSRPKLSFPLKISKDFQSDNYSFNNYDFINLDNQIDFALLFFGLNE
jgi:predicted RNA-binding Zn-ribbon protein involved in translation (DUF1610 family)